MNPIFNQNIFLVKEKIGMFKASNNYDIFNPENNELVLIKYENNHLIILNNLIKTVNKMSSVSSHK